jgi:sec-independent protein translocase protein TatB
MFSDIGPLEVVTLVVLAVILVGPEKLPKMVSDTVRAVRKLREFAHSAQEGIRSELPAELQDLTFEDLNPKAFVTKNLLGDQGLDLNSLTADLVPSEGPGDRVPTKPSKSPGPHGAEPSPTITGRRRQAPLPTTASEFPDR